MAKRLRFGGGQGGILLVEVRLLIDGFNGACSNISSIYLKVRDESMSAMRLCTIPKGDLPHLSYIFCKPEPLGTEFKTVA